MTGGGYPGRARLRPVELVKVIVMDIGAGDGREDAFAVVCAWCGAVVSGRTGGAISHGICPGCARRFLRRLPAAYLAAIADEDGSVTLFSGYRFSLEEVSAPGE